MLIYSGIKNKRLGRLNWGIIGDRKHYVIGKIQGLVRGTGTLVLRPNAYD
jgi:hypothetical protein